MDNNLIGHFSVDYKQIIIDEIALEGLEGIGVDLLWRRVGKRLSVDLTEKLKKRYWGFIVNNSKLSVYVLPEPVPHLEIIDRFTMIDESSGHLLEPDECYDGPYEYTPIENEHGSCKYYDTRQYLTKLKEMSYEEVMAKYGDMMVIVASVEERWHALAPHIPITYLTQMMPINYCLLELIGRARDNGQMSVGNTNLHKIMKDSKTLFYIRKQLQELDLIKLHNITQVINGKGIKCLLIRLKRFHKPGILSVPKAGMVQNVVTYLMKAPGYCERAELLVKKGLLTQKQNKRLQKTVNIFSFEDRTIVSESAAKNKKAKLCQKRYIFLSSKSDEEESEEESNEAPLTCQYKVGISIMRQAYEQFLDAGLQGLTQVQLSHLLGVEFYTSRTICRIFRVRNIVREYLEDKGKQRTARFIAVVATEKMDKKYEEQKNKFLEYLGQQNEPETPMDTTEPLPSTSDDEIPLKRIKLEIENKDNTQTDPDTADVELNEAANEITEIKVLDGFENSKSLCNFKKNPTLRQLKFANGLLKVLKEKLCVSGYMTLSNLAAKEVGEPPMDTKGLKSFIQKLVSNGHIKMYKIKWPGLQKYSFLICAHHIKITDPLIKAKYKEICMRAVASKKESAKREAYENNPAPVKIKRSYPRYMKIQKLHELVMEVSYFNYVEPESHSLPQGFICVVDLFPEATIEFLINNLCTSKAVEMYQLITEHHLQLKLKDAPQNIYKALMESKVIQNSIRINLKVLAMLGLIQLVSHQTTVTDAGVSMYSSFLFYVNRNAKILDTTGTWPRSMEETEELSFRFDTPRDVAKYWSEVYTISTSTEVTVADRGRKQLHSPLRPANDVDLYDTGERFGDCLGPCGFDSCFFMDIPRLWQTFYMRPNKAVIKRKPVIKKPKFETIKKTKGKKKKILQAKKRVAEVIPLPLKRRRPDGSVKWSKQEDTIINICKAAITIMSPSSQPGSLIVRNIVAKDLLSIYDPKKTKGLCHSRASTLDTNVTFVHEKQCIINELRRRRDLIQKYEGLLKKLRLKYSTNMTKYINKARTPMMELIWIILQVMQSKSYTQRMPCVAVSLEDFHAHFTITSSTGNKLCNMYKVSENSPLKEAIVVTIMQTIDGELDPDTAKKVYTTFKQYPETALRIAVEQLRKCSAIAAKEKLFNNQFRKLDLEDIVQSSYKISVFYRRRWISRLNSEFTDILAKVIDTVESENEIKGSSEINCAICELEACNLMEIESTTVPVIADAKGCPIGPGETSALVIDTKYSLKTGAMRWKKRGDVDISELYKISDPTASIQCLESSCVVFADEIQSLIPDMNDEVISHLKLKGEKGATFEELQDLFGYEYYSLFEKLLELEETKVIRRVGFYENVIVLTEYFKVWSTKIDDKYVICTPWLKLPSGIKLDVFLKWTSVVMNTIFEKPGCSIAYIADKSEFITYRATQDICTFLEKNNCVSINVAKLPLPSLFSDLDAEPTFYDYNPFVQQEDMLVFPTKNCVTKFSCLKNAIINTFHQVNCDVDENI